MSLLVFTKPFWLYSKKKSFSASSSFFSSRRQRRSSLVSWSFVMTRLWRRLSTALWTNSTRGWAPAISWPSFRYWKPARYSDCRHMCYHEEQYCEILWAFLLCKLHKWESSLLDSTKTELVAVFPYKAKKTRGFNALGRLPRNSKKTCCDTLTSGAHWLHIFVCVCVSPVREWLRLSVLIEVHYLEERVHSWQQQTLDRLWLFAVWKQGNNNRLLLPFNNSWYENIKVLVKCFSKNKAVARSVVSLQGPISCNATVLMSETEAETKQVDCQIGEWGWINSASD